jgi:hypothetical protein
MKSILFALALPLTLAFTVQASAASTYCRTVAGGGLGQPRGSVREHCVTLGDEGKLIDNANTFFGNPPEILPFEMNGNVVMVYRSGQWSYAYTLVGTTLLNGAGAVLHKK